MTIHDSPTYRNHAAPWIVQKFGGTSIAKYPLNVVDNVIRPATRHHRVVVVCSALSSTTKEKGTTNRLLGAYRQSLGYGVEKFSTIIQDICEEHINVAYDYVKSPELVIKFIKDVKRECDQILKLLQSTETTGRGTPQIMDRVIGAGERLACLFISAILCDRNVMSEVVDLSEIASSITCRAVEQPFYGNLSDLMARRVEKCWATVPVVTGFFGPIDRGVLAQVGRGYTDFCASMISVGLHAEELQIWKEVEGIFTADPSKVPSAKMISTISSEEASELTFHGSQVIHHAALRMSMRASISVRIKNVLNPQASGTLILDECKAVSIWPVPPTTDRGVALGELQSLRKKDTSGLPVAITYKDKILLINIRSAERVTAHSFLAGIFTIFDNLHLSIDLICTSEVQVSVAVHSDVSLVRGEHDGGFEPMREDIRGALTRLQEFGDLELLRKKTIISLVGKQVRHSLSIPGQMLSTLSDNCIKVDMMAHGASKISVSCVVCEQDAERAVALLHARFFAAALDMSSLASVGSRTQEVSSAEQRQAETSLGSSGVA